MKQEIQISVLIEMVNDTLLTNTVYRFIMNTIFLFNFFIYSWL